VLQNVTLKVYDILRREVATLVNEQKPAGTYNYQLPTCLTVGMVINCLPGFNV